jgi:hypothetical protein
VQRFEFRACEQEDFQMVKIVISTAFVLLVSSVPAMAQSAMQSTADTGNLTNTNYRPTENNYIPTGENAGTKGWADYTTSQGADSPNGPMLFGTPGSAAGPGGESGAATSAPYQGTYAAPGNFALRQAGRNTLPPTNLDSFVWQAGGHREHIYGDEGTDGPPPYNCFNYVHHIEIGINNPGLTTNHKSDAPMAWDYPQ